MLGEERRGEGVRKWELWKDDLQTSVKGGNGGSGRRSSQPQKGSTQRALLEGVYIKLAGQRPPDQIVSFSSIRMYYINDTWTRVDCSQSLFYFVP